MNIYNQIIKDGFGLVNLGRHLGLYYAPREYIANTPKGWLFIAVEDALTIEKIKEVIREYTSEEPIEEMEVD